MSGIRNQRNTVKAAFYNAKDELSVAIEDSTINVGQANELFQEVKISFHKYQQLCENYVEQLQVYKEIDKIARVKAENNLVESAYAEVSEEISNYVQYLQQKDVHTTYMSDPATILKQPDSVKSGQLGSASNVKDQIDSVVGDLERTLEEARQCQQDIYAKLGISTDIQAQMPPSEHIKNSKSPSDKDKYSALGPDRKYQYSRKFEPKFMSTPKTDIAHQHTMQMQQQPSRFVTVDNYDGEYDQDRYSECSQYSDRSGRMDDMERGMEHMRLPRGGSEPYHGPPGRQARIDAHRGMDDTAARYDHLKMMSRLSLPKFSGNKHAFESWHAAFMECVDKSDVPPEHKLLRLRDCLEGEALQSIQQLGYSGTAYRLAMDRLLHKYGGVRRQLTIRMEQLDKFKQVRDGNAKDLESFAELLDVLIVNLTEAGCTTELGGGSLYITLQRKLNEPLFVKYHGWKRERHLKESIETLRLFVNDEAESWMAAMETVKGLVPDKPKKEHGGRTLSTQDVPSAKKRPSLKCRLCSQGHGIWQCEQFRALSVGDRWSRAKQFKVCFKCLSVTHHGSTCERTRTCGLDFSASQIIA